MAYWLASEWCYGLTLPTLSLFADDTYGSSALNLWDDTLYVSGGGSVSDEVKQLRGLWEQITKAELNWITEYLRYGDMLPLAEVDFDATDWTVGLADTTYTSAYYNYDVVYDRAQYPKVVHGVWKSKLDGSCLVILANWTQSPAAWGGTISMSHLQTGGRTFTFGASMRAYDGSPDTDCILEFDQDTGAVAVRNIPAYSVKAILLYQVLDLSNLPLIATYSGRRRVGQVN